MTDNSDDFDKKFDEIINSSDDLKNIEKDFETEVAMGTKELILLQQSLCDVVSHISEILLQRNQGILSFVFQGDSIYHSLLSSLYKIAEDFNEVMLEYYVEDSEDLDEEDAGEDEGPF